MESGFKISQLHPYEYSSVNQVKHKNHRSATVFSDLVEAELKAQLREGNYVIASKPPLVTSPIGAILKDGGKSVRIIHDGSRPFGDAMNDYGSSVSVRYQTLADACELAKPGSFMCKIDLKSAYRSVGIHSSDYCLTGLSWCFKGDTSPTYLFDTRLPFGSNVAPSIFQRLTSSVCRMMKQKGFPNVIVYLDDFLIVEESLQRCIDCQHVLVSLLRSLGFSISWSKMDGPSQVVTFLGVLINSRNSTLSLDKDKVSKLHQQLLKFKSKVRASKRQFQSLAGLLNWACQCVRGGRYFLRRVLDLINSLKQGSHKSKLSKGFLADVEWWIQALSRFNGVAYYRSCGQQVVHTDACNKGAGSFCHGDWIYTNWKRDLPEAELIHINYKEVMAVVIATKRWCRQWTNCDIVVCTDSVVTKAIINKGTCKNNLVMGHLRHLFWLSVKHNFRLRAIHVPGAINFIADSVSRLHEKGQYLHLLSLLRNWYHNNEPIQWTNDYWSEHMSSITLQYITAKMLTNQPCLKNT